MKIRYDKEANAAYISFRENGKTEKTVPVNDDINVDFGAHGNVVGVEVLNARAHIPKNDLTKAALRKIKIPMMKFV
jgi:uncharacterized protein YuzE